jgi:hypothetical protein
MRNMAGERSRPRALNELERRALVRMTTSLGREASELGNALAQLLASGHPQEFVRLVDEIHRSIHGLETTRKHSGMILAAGAI